MSPKEAVLDPFADSKVALSDEPDPRDNHTDADHDKPAGPDVGDGDVWADTDEVGQEIPTDEHDE